MPISHTAIVLALRTHALALPAIVSSTGTLAATAAGYTRSDGGSFVTDGWIEGMEAVPAGFTQTIPGIVAPPVTASTLPIVGGRTVQADGAGRTLSFGFPPLREWENDEFPPKVNGVPVDTAGRYYVDEDYLPGPAAVRTTGPGRQVEHTPTYVLKLYSPPARGILAPYALADALLAHFAPHTALLLSTGDVLRVRGDVAPYRGQLTVREGYALIVVTIPLRLRTNST